MTHSRLNLWEWGRCAYLMGWEWTAWGTENSPCGPLPPFGFLPVVPCWTAFCPKVRQIEPSPFKHTLFLMRPRVGHSLLRINCLTPFWNLFNIPCSDNVPPKGGLKRNSHSHLFTPPLNLSWKINMCLCFFFACPVALNTAQLKGSRVSSPSGFTYEI